MKYLATCTLVCLLLSAATLAQDSLPSDVLVADFEGDTYGDWKAEGDAFGTGPARGTLPGQMHVSGFQGKGLVNSFLKGDRTTGTLTSPPIKIERKHLKFLVGGGGYPGKTCMNLLVDGEIVHSVTGPNTQGGGSEALELASWDISELAGKWITLQIVDNATGGWGHINVDHIVQSDRPAPPQPVEITRALRVDGKFLQLPLLQRANARQPGIERFTIESPDGEVLRFVHLQFPEPGLRPDFRYSYDIREFMGQEVVFRFKSKDPEVLNRLSLSDEEVIDPDAYTGANRPRFHFSPRIGWMNDINGTYYHDGLYHLFYQYNPTTAGRSTGFDMHWGHSVSKDLVHWEEWPIALFPDKTGSVYSGTACLIDQTIPGINVSAAKPTPALFFTATANPISQHMAITADGGRSWDRFSGNPVVPHSSGGNRDPKVFWHEPSGHYIMLLYESRPENGYSVRRSPNLTDWEQVGFLPGWYECPEFLRFTSPTNGKEVWVLYGNYNGPQPFGGENFEAPSAYQIGTFDGKIFTPTSNVRTASSGPNFYGAITFANEPNGRHIMMCWVRGGPTFPGEPFNQCASVPLNLTLKQLGGEDTLCMEPVDELEALRGKPLLRLQNVSIAQANDALAALPNETLLDMVIQVRPAANASVSTVFGNERFAFDASKSIVSYLHDGRMRGRRAIHPGDSISTRLLIDRSMIESFWNGGEASYCIRTETGESKLMLEGDAVVEELTVWPISDIWK
ncbi:MAG: glycoside hydrolase family 32 protein [Planctomycetota bacterium]